MIKKILNNRSGFSLAEVLIVVAIAASIVVVVANLNGAVNLLNGLVGQQLQSASDISDELQTMTAEIRSAETSQNGAYPIDSASTSSFAFYSDINKNGNVEHVRYFYATGTIYRGVITPTGTPVTYPTSSEVVTSIIGNIVPPATSSPVFSYYDDTYTGSQSPMTYPLLIPSVRLVDISFKVQQNQTSTSQRSPLQYFSSLVNIRILKDD